MMERVLSLHLPNWPIDRLRRRWPADRRREPLLLSASRGGAQWVAACSPEARARGVYPGMSPAHARAVAPSAVIAPHDPDADRDALESLALWAMRFSPAVAVDPPDGVLMDVTGCGRLFGGEHNVLAQVVDTLEGMGLTCNAAIADTIGAAWAVARAGEPRMIVSPCGQSAALAGLPPWSLRLPAAALDRLATLGIDRIEALLMLPRAGLPARFGEELLDRLDQALGHAPELIEPVREPVACAARMMFDGPVTHREVFDAALRRLVEQVADQLACRQLGAMRLEALLFRPREAPVTHGLTLCAPNRSARHLSDMLFAQLERVDWRIGFDGMEVAARRTGPLPPAQTDMFASDRARDPRAAAELWDRLAARLGREAVVRPQPVASHQPERAIAWRPIQVGPVQPLAHPFASLSNRPARLLRRPRRIEASAVAPDHPPFQIRARGRAWRVHCGDGPERIEPAWWSDDAGDAAISARAAAESDAEPRAPPARESRDYFRIELENGMRWWVYREASSRHWFVHGLFA